MWHPLLCYAFIKMKLVFCRLLLYVVYTCQKSFNFINGFACNVSWPRFIWPTLYVHRLTKSKFWYRVIARAFSHLWTKCEILIHYSSEKMTLVKHLVETEKNMPYWFNWWNWRWVTRLSKYTWAWRTQRNRLPQASVLAPILFSLYTNDLYISKGRKFIYADDICLAT